ncbi:MAG: tRNA uridine-5-carboxymethylaminomethyl(34) synthesis GTPase MnmE, partial [Candidatus Aminicenantes bacterium]
KALAPHIPVLEISALKRTHLKELEQTLCTRYIPDSKKNETVILHLRQKLLLRDVRESLEKASKIILSGDTEEVLVAEVRQSLPALSELIGEIQADDILNDIFSRFCVGK